MYKAILIGGDYDMTKLEVVKDLDTIEMFKKVSTYKDIRQETSSNVICEVLEYRIQCVTANGVLIYEFTGD